MMSGKEISNKVISLINTYNNFGIGSANTVILSENLINIIVLESGNQSKFDICGNNYFLGLKVIPDCMDRDTIKVMRIIGVSGRTFEELKTNIEKQELEGVVYYEKN